MFQYQITVSSNEMFQYQIIILYPVHEMRAVCPERSCTVVRNLTRFEQASSLFQRNKSDGHLGVMPN